MKKSSVATLVVGAAAFLAVGAAAASAQAKPAKPATSTTRIPVTKEQPGEVISKIDTVRVVKTDTVRIVGATRVDTVITTNTVTRYDTTRIETLPAYLISRGGMYFGLAGGIDFPRAAFRTVNQPGAAIQAQLGWQPVKSMLGLRADAGYTVYGEDATYANLGGRPDVITVSGDAKLQLPFLSHLFGQIPRFTVYAVGGGTYAHYKNLRNQLEPGVAGGTGPQNVILVSGSKLGWNAGGGVSWHWGANELFVESRIKSILADGSSDSGHMLPFMLGFNWY
jgi:hypothetical protein